MLIDELKIYLKRIGVSVRETAKTVHGLPLFVEAAYDWYDAEIGDFRLVLAVAKRASVPPDEVIAQWAAIGRYADFGCVMVIRGADENYCAVLDAAHVDYIMPGSRMHVEGKLMLVTRQAARAVYTPKGRMTVAAQQIILHYLLKGTGGRSTFKDLVASLGMCKVQVSDAALELERLNLCTVDRAWRAHALVWPEDKRRLWNLALPKMDTPVQRKLRVRKPPKGLPVAGIEALASMSMLASDGDPTYAMSRKDARVKALADERYVGATVEVWKYDPLLFSADGSCIDPLSLYLSLREDPDPRVQGELKTVLEEMKW